MEKKKKNLIIKKFARLIIVAAAFLLFGLFILGVIIAYWLAEVDDATGGNDIIALGQTLEQVSKKFGADPL